MNAVPGRVATARAAAALAGDDPDLAPESDGEGGVLPAAPVAGERRPRTWVDSGLAVALGLAGLTLEALLARSTPSLPLQWVQPTVETICCVAALSVAYLCLRGHRTSPAPLAWWLGLVFASVADLDMLFVLTFPGLVGDGGVLGANPSTSGYFFSLQYAVLGAGVLVATALGRRGYAPTTRFGAYRLLAVTQVATLALGAVVVVLGERGALPVLVGPNGFTAAQAWLNRGAALLLVAGGVALARLGGRPGAAGGWLAQPLLASLGLLTATVLVTEFPIERFDQAWYLVRAGRLLAFGLMFFAFLSEYPRLYRNERRRAETQARLRESEARYRTLARHFPNGAVALFDPALRFQVADGGGAALGGRPPAELLGRTLWEVLPSESSASVEPLFRAALDGEEASAEVPSGDRVYAIHTVPVRDPLGAIVGGMLLTQDVTERTRAAAALRGVNAELEQFAYTVSHDLKAPLVTIQGFAHRLAADYAGQLDEPGRRYLARIEANATHLADLIDDVLTFSRVGRVGAPPVAVALGEAVRRNLDNLQETVERTGAAVHVHEPLPTVVASPTLVDQILSNLLANALTYGTKPGMGATVEVGCEEDGEFWRLYVRDAGTGIPVEQQGRLFRLFERLPAGKATDAHGTGVGLATVRKAAAALGGEAGLDSALDAGATFWVRIPKTPTESPSLAAP